VGICARLVLTLSPLAGVPSFLLGFLGCLSHFVRRRERPRFCGLVGGRIANWKRLGVASRSTSHLPTTHLAPTVTRGLMLCECARLPCVSNHAGAKNGRGERRA